MDPLTIIGGIMTATGAGLDYREYVKQDPSLLRPAEVDVVVGDASKARDVLGWTPTVHFDELVRMMVDADMQTERGP